MSLVHFPCGLQNRAGLPPQSRENNRVEPFQNAFLWPLFSQSTYSYVSGGWQFKVWAEVGAKLSPQTVPSVPRRQNLRQIVVGTSINNKRRLYVFGALKNLIYRLLCAKRVRLCRRLSVTNVPHLMSTVENYKLAARFAGLTLALLFWPQHQGRENQISSRGCESSDTEEHFLLLVCEYDTGECAWLLRAWRNLNQGTCFWSFKCQTQTIIEDEKLWNSLGHRRDGLTAVRAQSSVHVDFPLPGPNPANLDRLL